MPSRHALNTYHIMCSVKGDAALLQIQAPNGREALTEASRVGMQCVVLFTTRTKHPAH